MPEIRGKRKGERAPIVDEYTPRELRLAAREAAALQGNANPELVEAQLRRLVRQVPGAKLTVRADGSVGIQGKDSD